MTTRRSLASLQVQLRVVWLIIVVAAGIRITVSAFTISSPNNINKNKASSLWFSSSSSSSSTSSTSSSSPNFMIQRTWEDGVADMIRTQLQRRKTTNESSSSTSSSSSSTASSTSPPPYMVAVVGIPGSGKTTSSHILVELLSANDNDNNVGAMLIPFDGYHLPLAVLQTFPNAADALYRRGAPDTFDAARLVQDLTRLRHGQDPKLYFPAFDHARGDPEPNAHEFCRAQHQVVICEGLYLLHDQDGWEQVKSLFDFSIFVNADIDTCIARLKIRNKAIPGYTPQQIDVRCDVVDRANAHIVERSKVRADLIVDSAAMVS